MGMRPPLYSVVAAFLLGMGVALAAESEQTTQKPYTVVDGPDGAGSSYAPDLVDSVKHMSKDNFEEVVVNGRTNVNAANENVMPPFGEVEDVVTYLDDIWAYFKARADGVLGRGRPPRIGD